MRFYDIFNGDADGLCALHQLRLAEPCDATLITGVKRDIALLARVAAQPGDELTVLDVSLDTNREALLGAVVAAVADANALIVADYDKGTLDAALASALIAAAQARGVPVIVDPKQRNFFAYAGATVFKPNRRELELALNAHFSGDDSDLEAARVRVGAEHLLLTLGADGMALLTEGKPLRRTPSIAHEVFDVSGAGDTVSSVVALALGAGASIEEAAWVANLAAGVEVGKRGTATVSRDELLKAWDNELGEG